MFDKVTIVDQTITAPVPAALNVDRPTAFIPIFSPRGYGKDTELTTYQGYTQSTLVNRYGTPSLNNTLAPIYYAYEFLRGGGDVITHRVTSKTSTYAHNVILAKGRVKDDVFEVKFEIKTINDAVNLESLITAAEALATTVADVDGYRTYPIAVHGLNWTGVEGNKYTWRLVPDRVTEKVIPQRAYTLESRRSVSSSPQSVSFSTHIDAVLDSTSIYADEYVETRVPDVFFRMLDTYDTFLAAIAAYVPAGEEYPDIFFGNTKANVAYPNYQIQDTSVDFTAVGGLALAGGGDGDFARTEPNRVTNMMARMAEIYNEEPALLLVNEYRYTVDYVFDFGATQAVKDALVTFAGRRQTTKPVIDFGLQGSAATILAMRVSGDLAYDSSAVHLQAGYGQYTDPFTNKRLTMPLSFFDAFALPNLINSRGGHWPQAGANYPYSNMIAGSYKPAFYDENSDIVQSFIDNRINFAMEEVGGYVAAHQSTAKKQDSALVEKNNMYLLHLIIRIGLRTAKQQRWNFATDTDIEKYQAFLIQNIGFQLDGKLDSFTLTAQREDEIGPGRNRVRVDGVVKFKDINKGTSFFYTVV
jgi:hypothetical protein